ncbi:hypothetical protein YB2330_005472 [Saitoella coloradoensis]
MAGSSRASPYFFLVVTSIILGTFQYGYHIAALNTPEKVVRCQTIDLSGTNVNAALSLPNCISLNDNEYSMVTALYNLGGMIGALASQTTADRFGRQKSTLLYSFIFLVGGFIFTFATNYAMMVVGRLILGVGAGFAGVIGSLWLNESAPAHLKGPLGVASQLAICTGILLVNVFGLALSTTSLWRIIFFIGLILALMQFCITLVVGESPKWLATFGQDIEKAKYQLGKLRGLPSDHPEVEAEIYAMLHNEEAKDANEPLPEHAGNAALFPAIKESAPVDSAMVTPEGSKPASASVSRAPSIIHEAKNEIAVEKHDNTEVEDVERSGSPGPRTAARSHEAIPFWKFIFAREWRKPFVATVFVMLGQQWCGINAVNFFSTNILTRLMPDKAQALSITLSAIQLLATFIPVVLLNRVGRRTLELWSIGSYGIFTIVLGIGLNINNAEVQKGLGMFGLIMLIICYSGGIGPLPFIITPEIVDIRAAGVAQSLGLAICWLSAFVIGLIFLPIQEAIGANVWFVFTACCGILFVGFFLFVPETFKNGRVLTPEQVWIQHAPGSLFAIGRKNRSAREENAYAL